MPGKHGRTQSCRKSREALEIKQSLQLSKPSAMTYLPPARLGPPKLSRESHLGTESSNAQDWVGEGGGQRHTLLKPP